jgi:single-stranded-DNA-specific exonuclease
MRPGETLSRSPAAGIQKRMAGWSYLLILPAASPALIGALNRGRNLVLILDHHPARPVETRRLYHLNPELSGLKGDRDISASTNCFLFAKALDPDNSDLAHLAVIGAVGDNFLDGGRLSGANRQAALEAQGCNTIEIQIGDGAESYHLAGAGRPRPVPEVVDMVETLGAAGYYQGGAELGVECLLSGFSDLGLRRYQSLGAMKRERFQQDGAPTRRRRAAALFPDPVVPGWR